MERIFGKIKRLTRKLDGKCITAKFMSAVLIASTVLNAAVPAMAYAAEPELATVSCGNRARQALLRWRRRYVDGGRGRHRCHRESHPG